MKYSIKYVLIFGLTILLFISLSIALVSSYKTSQKAMIKHAKEIMENISTYTIEKSRNYLFFARDAARLTSSLANTNIVSKKNKEQMKEYFYNQLCTYPQFSGIYFAEPDGSFVMVSRVYIDGKMTLRTKTIDTKGARKVDFIWEDFKHNVLKKITDNTDAYDPTVRPWYKKAVKAKKLIWTSPYIFYTSKKPGITTSTPVYSKQGELQGVIGVDIEIDEISDFLSKLKIGKHGLAFILNNNGDVIAFPDKSLITNNAKSKLELKLTKIDKIKEPISKAAFESLGISVNNINFTEPVFTKFTYNDKVYHAMFAPFVNEYWNWSIGIYVPEDDYLGVIKQSTKNNIIFFALVFLIYGFIAFLTGRSIEKPLSNLEKEAVAIASGDKNKDLSVNTIYKEIQNMADSFSIMQKKLQDKQQELEEINMQLVLEIKEKIKTENLLKSSLEEKELLLKEIHHRVKNNLQIISSLLNLQQQHYDNKEVKEIILNSQNRIYSMATVHNYLYRSNNLAKISLFEYIDGLVKHIIITFDGTETNTEYKVIANDISLPIDIAITVGLIINETVTNSMKYAFKDKENPFIQVIIDRNANFLILKVIDNGNNFQKIFDAEKTPTLGIKLIKTMVAQFNGTVEINSDGENTIVEIKLDSKLVFIEKS